jgi:hypothetical protein
MSLLQLSGRSYLGWAYARLTFRIVKGPVPDQNHNNLSIVVFRCDSVFLLNQMGVEHGTLLASCKQGTNNKEETGLGARNPSGFAAPAPLFS